jgi:hypothetical protein
MPFTFNDLAMAVNSDLKLIQGSLSNQVRNRIAIAFNFQSGYCRALAQWSSSVVVIKQNAVGGRII